MKTDRPVAIITGVSRGIGRAIALYLSQTGYDIAGISRTIDTPETAEQTAELESSIRSNGTEFVPFRLDISETGSHQEIIESIFGRFGRIDMLVNNAGVAPLKRLDVTETTTESYDRVMSINLRGPLFFTQKVVRKMLDMEGKISDFKPLIIFITSVSAVLSSTNRIEYCISKAGLSMACQVFAHRLAKTGIRVYELRPGIIRTDMTTPVKSMYDRMIEEGLIPQDRWGYPEDIARAVVAISNGYFDYSTGGIFEVSGGMNIRRL
ncbi:MAG: 3-ketoacyl-ACP reductase [Bacteroidales bacterium]|nr:MAG: 3-ketoacyl-ACP reductase [Bacteroidales bacterium]